jgi:glycosyltransferase involved in cell wall biosynthesis
MKKICFVVGHVRYHVGGAEVQSIGIARELLHRGYEVSFLNNPIRGRRTFPEREVIDGIEVYNYRGCNRFRVLDLMTIRNLLRRINADVYYLRACPFNEGFVTFLANRRGARTIWQCASGRSLIRYVSMKDLFRSHNALSIVANVSNAVCEDCLRLYAIRNCTYVVAQTEANKGRLHQEFNRDSVIIRKGIDAPSAHTQKDLHQVNVMCLRNMHGNMRLDLFLDVARRFKGRTDISFAIAGRMETSRVEMLDAIRQSGAAYLGFLEHDQALAALAKAHILIDTLEKREGQTTYSTAFLEAWSRGVAILSLWSNPDDVFRREHVGYVVDSVDQCVERIEYLVNHRDVLSKIGMYAREYVRMNHSSAAEVEKIVELCE